MAVDLTGITNENEFYSTHYLSAILENDLKDLFREWERREAEERARPPYEGLRRIARDYFTMKSALLREKSIEGRMETTRVFASSLLGILGYEVSCTYKGLDAGAVFPVLAEVSKPDGSPLLWVVEALDPKREGNDPLLLTIAPCQLQGQEQPKEEFLLQSLEALITGPIFGRSEPPRWVIVMSDRQIILLERGKWQSKRLLRFDCEEIFGRRELSTFKAMTALLHRESTCPPEGMSLLDTLDENSHKHAFAVSEDLKYALREAIALPGACFTYDR